MVLVFLEKPKIDPDVNRDLRVRILVLFGCEPFIPKFNILIRFSGMDHLLCRMFTAWTFQQHKVSSM